MLSLEPHDTALAEALTSDPTIRGDRIVRDRMSGGSELLNIMVTLTPMVLTAVVKILHDKWTRDSKVKIQARGIKLEGVSPAQAEALLRQLLQHSDAPKD